MVKTRLWFRNVERRHVDYVIKPDGGNQIAKYRRERRKTIKETIKKDADINEFEQDYIWYEAHIVWITHVPVSKSSCP